jgi:pyrroloquinoline quinone (PQQ) biosynthesis protein C
MLSAVQDIEWEAEAADHASFYRCIQQLLYTEQIDALLEPRIKKQLRERCCHLTELAFHQDNAQALLAVHRVLNVLYMSALATPWSEPAVNTLHPFLVELRHDMEGEWEARERTRHAEALAELPEAADFEQWARDIVRGHTSNVSHPLFTFLRDDATYAQMREFFLQETPLEVLFGDVVAFMLPGIYGAAKMELVQNFWDEVGRAEDARVHRNLRFQMMRLLNIPEDVHLRSLEQLVVEELQLINTYLMMATHRARMTQLVGVLLATETMIPGRFDYQIQGWRRLGLRDEQMEYLLVHTTVDDAHANGWLDNVVRPILKAYPSAVHDLGFGVLRRLHAANAVCDRMMTYLTPKDRGAPQALLSAS